MPGTLWVDWCCLLGTFYIAQAGGTSLVNAHHPYGSQIYSLDILKLNGAGRNATGLVQTSLEQYAIFGSQVYSPCDGKVAVSIDGLDDLPPGAPGDTTYAPLAAWVGIIGPALFVTVFLLEGWLRPGYNPMAEYVSALSLGGRGWVQIVNFLLFGALLFGFTRAVAAEFPNGKGSHWGLILLTAISICYFFSGPFVMDPVSTPPAEMTTHGTLHGILGAIVFVLMPIPSGGVWTTAEDMARYLQFHINAGSLDGKRLLRADLAETMLTPPNPAALHADPAYALGVYSYNPGGARYVQHGGGGFGVTNYMAWYPDLKLGAVVLSNAITPRGYAVGLCENVLVSIINNNIPLYHERDRRANPAAPAYPPVTDGAVLTDDALRNLVESAGLIPHALPKVNQSGDLTEVQPGLFVTGLGNTFDLRGPVLMVDNFVGVKINPQALPFKIAFYALCALLFLSALFAWPAGALFRLLKRRQAWVSEAAQKGSPWPVLVGLVAALAALISLFCLAIVALMPNLVYFPWPSPWADLLWWQSAIFRLPVAGMLLGAAIALAAGFFLRIRPSRWYYLAVGLAVLVCNGVILV